MCGATGILQEIGIGEGGEEGEEEKIGEEGSEHVEDGQVGELVQSEFVLELSEQEVERDYPDPLAK